jgi:hypothetical protein
MGQASLHFVKADIRSQGATGEDPHSARAISNLWVTTILTLGSISNLTSKESRVGAFRGVKQAGRDIEHGSP